jgi:hypothetical protein
MGYGHVTANAVAKLPPITYSGAEVGLESSCYLENQVADHYSSS